METNRVRQALWLVAVMLMVGVGCSSMTGPDGGGGGGAGGGGGGAGGGTGGGGTGGGVGGGSEDGGLDGGDAGTFTVSANCTGYCARVEGLQCGDVPGNCGTACEQIFLSFSACGDLRARYFNCVAALGAREVHCDGGFTLAPACAPVAQLVRACETAVETAGCYGAACGAPGDCDGGACNGWTDRCVTTTACTGLPCDVDADCNDSSLACSSMWKVCVAK